MLRFIALALLAMMLFAAPNAGAAPIIDDFTTTTSVGPTTIMIGSSVFVLPGLQVSNASPGPVTVVDNPATNTLGGIRTVVLGPYTGPANMADNVSVTVDGGVLNFNSSTAAKAPLVLRYDAGGAGFDDSFLGYDALTLAVLNFDFAFGNPLPISAKITDTSNISATQTVNVSMGGAQPIGFDLSGFTGVDLDHVKSVELTFTGNTAHNFTIDAIQLTTIPEPATLALWGALGVAGAWYARRRLLKPKEPAEA